MVSKVSGFGSLTRSLRQLARELDGPIGDAQRRSLGPTLRAVKNKLLQNGSFITGDLYKGMAIRTPKKPRKDVKRSLIAATGKAIRKAHLVEFGTEAHYQPKRNIMHPGAVAKPFLTPVFEEDKDDIIIRFGRHLGPAIERKAARLRLRGR